MRLTFRVIGVAQQMGSKRAFIPKGWTRAIVTDTNRNLKGWQQLVAEAASHAIQELSASDRGLLLEGVRLTLTVFLPRPKSLPRRVTAHLKAPDLDKLVRSIQDALIRVVFRDDAQIVDLVAMKRYAAPGEVPHVDIRVEPSAGLVPIRWTQSLFEFVPAPPQQACE